MNQLLRGLIVGIVLGSTFVIFGCKNADPSGVPQPSVDSPSEMRVRDAAAWVKKHAGLIQVAVQATTQIAIFSAETDAGERQKLIEDVHVVVVNLNSLITSGSTDPASVRNALSINEPYLDAILQGIGKIYAAEYLEIVKNGYADFAIELLKAVSKGMADGTVQ